MARCPFAKWQPVKYDVGNYVGGPFRIVHHTTEGATAAGALAIFVNEYAPHFLVDKTTIYQLVDTDKAASSMRNKKEWPETNRLSAIQIELVGFAGKPKDKDALVNLRKLLRWIEETHDVPREWPNGPCRPAIAGKDPGKHNRDAKVWATKGGHYGHEHVPENIHWDPAYTKEETEFLMKVDEPTTEVWSGCPT